MNMKNEIKLQIAEHYSGETVSIGVINAKSIKNLKQWVSSMYNISQGDCHFDVLFIEDNAVEKWFNEYLQRKINHEKYEELIVVGVSNKRLEEKCYQFDSIRPLHICQSLAANFRNFKTALKDNDKEWLKELSNQRFDLYHEAITEYNISMTELNSLMWGQYKHEITEYKFLDYEFNKRFMKIKTCRTCGNEFKTTTHESNCDECSKKIFDEAMENEDWFWLKDEEEI